jgi:hypothetical protein
LVAFSRVFDVSPLDLLEFRVAEVSAAGYAATATLAQLLEKTVRQVLAEDGHRGRHRPARLRQAVVPDQG